MRLDGIDPELERTTVRTLTDALEVGRHLKPKTIASYRSLLSSRVLPEFGHRELRTVKPSDGAMIDAGLGPSHIRQAHVVLPMVFDVAVKDGYLLRNPASGTRLPRMEHREAAYFEPRVVDRIVDAVRVPTTSWWPCWAFAASDGAKPWR